MSCVENSNTNGPCPQWAYNTGANQLTTSGFTYDAAGNLTKDSSNATTHTWQWDGEGRVASADSGSTWGFTYNAVGDRAQWAYTGGADQHLFDPSGTWLGNAGSYSLVPFGGRYFALYYGGNTLFNHVNALDSASMRTLQSGAEAEDILFYPWGDVWEVQGSGGYNFAGMPYRDVTTTTDLTTFRVFSPNIGRWHSPDPLGGDVANPQSLNRYPYVLNNPTTLTDPLGLQGCPPGTSSMGPGQCAGPASNPLAWWGWDEFDLMNIPVTTLTGYGWQPIPNSAMPGPSGADYNSWIYSQWMWGPIYSATGLSALDYLGWPAGSGLTGPATPAGPANPAAPRRTVQAPTKAPPQPGTYGAYALCAASEFINQGFGNEDLAGATVLANIAPYAFAAAGAFPAAGVSAIVQGIYDLNLALSIRATCKQEVYGQ
jgi:RHS repeat-associated protein